MTRRCVRVGVLVILLAATAVAAGRGREATADRRVDAQSDRPASLFAVRFQPGPEWNKTKPPGEQTGFAAHSANLQRLRREGSVVLGGRFADVGLIVVRAADAASARELFASDATITARVFAMQIDQWSTIFEGCTPGAARTPLRNGARFPPVASLSTVPTCDWD